MATDATVARYRGGPAEFHDVRPAARSAPCGRRLDGRGRGATIEFLLRGEAEALGLAPCERCFSSVVVVRRHTPDEIAEAITRLLAAGLTEEAAERVARHPSWGPVSLAPGVIVSLHPLRDARADVAVA